MEAATSLVSVVQTARLLELLPKARDLGGRRGEGLVLGGEGGVLGRAVVFGRLSFRSEVAQELPGLDFRGIFESFNLVEVVLTEKRPPKNEAGASR